jgi:hypothetical protein
MSAFVVSKFHIDSVVSAALNYKAEGISRETATDVGRPLWIANISSVAHGYPHDREHTECCLRIAEV